MKETYIQSNNNLNGRIEFKQNNDHQELYKTDEIENSLFLASQSAAAGQNNKKDNLIEYYNDLPNLQKHEHVININSGKKFNEIYI